MPPLRAALPSSVSGSTRSDLVSCYRKWRGANHVPSTVHAAIHWKKSDPFLDNDIKDVPWELLSDKPNQANSDNDMPEANELHWNPTTPGTSKRKHNDDEKHTMTVQRVISGPKSKDQEPPQKK